MLNISEPNQDNTSLHPQGQSRIKPIANLIGVHHRTLRRWWKAGKFPKPLGINGILLFKNAEVLAWLEKAHQASDGGLGYE